MTLGRDPGRTTTTPVYTINQDLYREVESLELSDGDVRNQVRVWYSDAADRDSTGSPKRKFVFVQDSNSAKKYGIRYMEVAEASSSNIDSQTEAQRLAEAALNDLKEPVVQASIVLPYMHHLELGDLIQLGGNNEDFSSSYNAAITSVAHSFSAPDEDGQFERSTTLGLRFAGPVSQALGWLEVEARPGQAPTAPESKLSTPASVLVERTEGGVTVAFAIPQDRDSLGNVRFFDAELHLGDTSGFTPSSSTLAAVVRGNKFTLGNLLPGRTYYVRVVARDIKGNLSEPTTATLYTVPYISPYQLQPTISYNRLPVNGDFEAQTFPNTAPDTWEALYYPWGQYWVMDTGAYSGKYSLLLKAGSPNGYLPGQLFAELKSQPFTAVPGQVYLLRVNVYSNKTSNRDTNYNAPFVYFDWLDANNNIVGFGGYLAPTTAGQWLTTERAVTAPAGTRYGRVVIRRDHGDIDAIWQFDSVNVDRGSFSVEDEATLPLSNGWTVDASGGPNITYYKDGFGTVTVVGTALFNNFLGGPRGVPDLPLSFPAGYRPRGQIWLPVTGTTNDQQSFFTGIYGINAAGQGVLFPTGQTIPGGGQARLSLSSIRFRAYR